MIRSERIKKSTVLLGSALVGCLLLSTVIYAQQNNNDRIYTSENQTDTYFSSQSYSQNTSESSVSSCSQTKNAGVSKVKATSTKKLSVSASAETTGPASVSSACITEVTETPAVPETELITPMPDNTYAEQPAEPQQVQPQPEIVPVQNVEIAMTFLGTFESTAYTWTGCRCASGNYPYSCSNTEGINYRSVAVDSSVIPLGTRMYIEAGDYSGYVIAEDTGGAINGFIMDLYMDSYDECINWGRRNINVFVLS